MRTKKEYSDFFEVFSKMECALKQTRFRKSDEGLAEPDWDKFASTVSSKILSLKKDDLIKALDFYRSYPPKQQMVRAGSIKWESVPFGHPPEQFAYFTDAIRKVRNNLFHGGKFNMNNGINYGPDKKRNSCLVRHAVVILTESVKIEPDVSKIFSEIGW